MHFLFIFKLLVAKRGWNFWQPLFALWRPKIYTWLPVGTCIKKLISDPESVQHPRGGGGSPESKTAKTVEEGYVSHRRAAPARISVCASLMTLGGYFKHFPMQQLSALLQIPSGSDCPHENLFKIGLNSNTRQSSSAMRDSHHYFYIILL